MDSYFTDEQTLTLLKLVHTKDMQDKFNSNKKKHRKVWEEISGILELQGIKKSAAKCQNRYENTKRSYNTIKRNHVGPPKPNYAYWDFWESIKRDVPFEGFEEFHETFLRLKQAASDKDAVPDWEHWMKYEEYYKQRELMTEQDHINCDNVKSTQPTIIFTDRETDELLLIMGEPATRQIFIKHRKKHRIAWNYILKCLKRKGIHKTVDKVKNRFENLKRKYVHYKKNLNDTNGPPDWRYWNVFEEYMASRPNPTESDFMADDEHETTVADDGGEGVETDFEETKNQIDKHSLQDDQPVWRMENTYQPIASNRKNEKFCRICLQYEQLSIGENMVSLFSPLNANIRINEALAMCVGIEIFYAEQDASIGNEICMECMKQLQTTYDFRKLCWASEYELKANRNVEKALNSRLSLTFRKPSSPRSETFYEFVDADPMPTDCSPLQCVNEKDMKNDDNDSASMEVRTERITANIEYIKKHLVKIHALVSDSQNFKNYLELSNCDSDDELDDNVKCYICYHSYVKREYLKKHLKLIHNVTDADYNVYERIDEENKTKKPMNNHLQKVHGVAKLNDSEKNAAQSLS